VTAVTDSVAGKFDVGFVTVYLLHSYRASKLIRIEPVQLIVATWGYQDPENGSSSTC